MNMLPALAPWMWAVLAAVPIGIILLYFLKLRRQPVEVPSTYLWARTIEDLHVNSLLQRLRRNLLLLLQLLFIALAAFALLRPGWRTSAAEGQRLIFLLDSSASMQATDIDRSRFAEAKRQIEQQIEAMADSDAGMLIAFSDRADVLQGFTSDRRRLRQALDAAEPTNRPTDLLEALRAAAGLANPGRTSQAGDVDIQVADPQPATLYIYSDGGFPPATDFDLGNLTPVYRPIGSDAPQNLAIVAFSTDRNPERPGDLQAFAQVANTGTAAMQTTASLMRGDALLDASQIELEPGDRTGLTFDLDAEDTTALRLEIDSEDHLAVDDVAFAALSPPRHVQVLLATPQNRALELALATSQTSKLCEVEVVAPDYLDGEAYRRRAAAGEDDLIIYDRCSPAEMPATNTWFIGSLPPDRWQAGPEESPLAVIDVDRVHPVMRYLELFSLQIVEGRPLEPPPGADVLITADSGPILAVAPRSGFQDMVLGFELIGTGDEGASVFNTDWPIQRSWPVFVYNILQHVAGALDVSGSQSVRPGTAVELRLPSAAEAVDVVAPGPRRMPLSLGPGGTGTFTDTEWTGAYRVEQDERLLETFTVNLFDERESQLLPADSIELGYEEIAGESPTGLRRAELWRWLLLAALGMLAAEWWLYNRRVAV